MLLEAGLLEESDETETEVQEEARGARDAVEMEDVPAILGREDCHLEM